MKGWDGLCAIVLQFVIDYLRVNFYLMYMLNGGKE